MAASTSSAAIDDFTENLATDYKEGMRGGPDAFLAWHKSRAKRETPALYAARQTMSGNGLYAVYGVLAGLITIDELAAACNVAAEANGFDSCGTTFEPAAEAREKSW